MSSPSNDSNRVSPAQAHEQSMLGEAVLLDVREACEWLDGHAPTAVHLPLDQLLAGAKLPEPAGDGPVVTICRSGNRSRTAAAFLVSNGIQATDVVGGMNAWAHEGLPVALGSRGDGVAT